MKLRNQELEKRIKLERMKQSTSRVQVQKDEKPEQISSDVQQVKATLLTCASEEEVMARAVEQHLNLPKTEVRRLDGNLKSYWSSIQIATKGKRTDNQARLTQLIQFCDCLAKTAI
ncbi:hypothetical protein EG68_07773 [Paragonimus skrjabini miyazakii]|uniref:Uncharacterized protein n=1 Tax=Paragonimus skrjabini miyazakii TaxID=59628 RepID=A0A8S9YRU6_9TREM|nr:hypothetical protein EG68_07773 [Paragonimus skrjabini miyazakii]